MRPATPATPDTVAVRRCYDRISRAYDVIADASEHAVREQGVQALSLARGDRVLEIGCGTGHGLVAIAGAVGASGRVYGIDISEGMTAVARRRVESRDECRVSLVRADARLLCFRAAVFDAVFFSFTLELFGAAVPFVLREARRVLRVGGRIGVVGMAAAASPGPATGIYLWFHRHFPHLVDCEPIDIGQAIANAGFEVDSVAVSTIWKLPVAVVVGRNVDD